MTAPEAPWCRDVPNTGGPASTKAGVRRLSEKRLLKINYAGSGNNSQFACDGFGHTVKIVETTGGSTTNTKQFVWCSETMCEARDNLGSMLNKYFLYGQTVGGSNYFYAKDQLENIRELTDSSGNIQAAYKYDAFGRALKTQGTLASDFQYAGYYYHGPSGLNLTINRQYNANLARWLSPDPAGEDLKHAQAFGPSNPTYQRLLQATASFQSANPLKNTLRVAESLKSSQPNLYPYVSNAPVNVTDPSGLGPISGGQCLCLCTSFLAAAIAGCVALSNAINNVVGSKAAIAGLITCVGTTGILFAICLGACWYVWINPELP